jgi:Spy/CpxP family protein refolding chaperone
MRGAMMNDASHALSYAAQCIGLVATVFGTAFGLGSLIVAWVAASRAKGAHEAAESARQAAVKLGRIAHLGDLIADVQELQTLLARGQFEAIADKANLLRGRIVRFKKEAYIELGVNEQEDLDSARAQFEVMVKAAMSKTGERRRVAEIQVGYGQANEALNRVFAMLGQKARGE